MLRQRLRKACAAFDILGDLPYDPAEMRMTRALLDLVQSFEKRDPDFDQEHELPPEVGHHPDGHALLYTGSEPGEPTGGDWFRRLG
jgi:hypothetical protein